jgi:Holliday junction resolvase-like predicted endonuclease
MNGSTAAAARRAPLFERALEEAAHHLERLGYRELDRQVDGCDLVVASSHQLVFCRLHAQRGLGRAPERREPPPRHELRRAGCRWLTRQARLPWSEVRFDLLFVLLGQDGDLVGVEHQPDAF